MVFFGEFLFCLICFEGSFFLEFLFCFVLGGGFVGFFREVNFGFGPGLWPGVFIDFISK